MNVEVVLIGLGIAVVVGGVGTALVRSRAANGVAQIKKSQAKIAQVTATESQKIENAINSELKAISQTFAAVSQRAHDLVNAGVHLEQEVVDYVEQLFGHKAPAASKPAANSNTAPAESDVDTAATVTSGVVQAPPGSGAVRAVQP